MVIPVVNPDGFNASREAGELQGAAGGRSADDDTAETANIVSHPNEYRRKNCRNADDSEGGSLRAAGLRHRLVRRRPEPQLRRPLGRPGRKQ